MKIYVGNLPYTITEADLQELLAQFGKVESTAIIKDKHSGQSKGFGFVEMESQTEGQAAIDALNGQEHKGRTLKVNEARPQTENGGGRGGRGGGRGGQGGDRGGRGGGAGRGGQGGGRSGQSGDRGGRGGGAGRGGQGGQGGGRSGQGGDRGGRGGGRDY